jgi:hypothetical protein
VYPVAAAHEKRCPGAARQGRKRMERDIEIMAAGQKVELNPFAASIVVNTLVGLLGSLKGVKLDGEVRVILKPKAHR